MQNLRRLLFVLWFILFLTVIATAQNGNSTLVINVTDPLGNIVPGADVQITSGPKLILAAKTNDNGTADIRRLAEGKYQVQINVVGFKEYRGEIITIGPREGKQLDIVLVSVDNVFNFNNKDNPIGNMSSPNFLRTISGFSSDGSFSQSSPRKISFGSGFSF